MTKYGLAIFEQHAALLEDSAIDPDVARERGYVSVDTGTRLAPAKFSKGQRITPGLLIPIYGTDGTLRLHQYRPDNPRLDDKGKPRKYETPWRQSICLDVPRRLNGQLADPDVALWITEGARKADAAVSAGLCCISLIVVDGWQSKGIALPDWKDIRLKDRDVLVAFDSDVMTKASVAGALKTLTGWLQYRGARVRWVILPAGDDAKVGLDDYLAGGGNIADLIMNAAEPAAPAKPVAAATPRAVTSHVHTPPPWASDQDILTRLTCDMAVWCGFTGEHRNARLIYLAVTSRILDDPVSIAVKGLSSSGKSYTVVSVLKFFPGEAVITMTAMSERALVYMEDDFAHRTLVLYEAVALREEREKTESNLTAYIVRSLLSEGEIRYPVATRGADGKMVTQWIIKNGPTNFIVTTTATSLHGENETRMLSLPTDDSATQTSAIMASIAAGQRPDARLQRMARLRRLDRRGQQAGRHSLRRLAGVGNPAGRCPAAA